MNDMTTDEEDDTRVKMLNETEPELVDQLVEMLFSEGAGRERARENVNRLWERIENEVFKSAYQLKQQSSGEGG